MASGGVERAFHPVRRAHALVSWLAALGCYYAIGIAMLVQAGVIAQQFKAYAQINRMASRPRTRYMYLQGPRSTRSKSMCSGNAPKPKSGGLYVAQSRIRAQSIDAPLIEWRALGGRSCYVISGHVSAFCAIQLFQPQCHVERLL